MRRYLILVLAIVSFSCQKEFSIKKIQVDSLPFSEKEYKESKGFVKPNEPWISFTYIDSTGRYVLEDNYEGSNSGYYFYSKDGEQINKYRPYTFFSNFDYSFDETNLVVAAIKNESSDSIKIARLDHNGNLLAEIQIIRPNSDVRIRTIHTFNNLTVLILNNLNKEFLLKVFDNELNEIWSRNINGFLFHDGFSMDKERKNMFLSTKRKLISLNLNSGKENWTNIPFEQNDTKRVYKTSLLFNNNYIGLYKFGIVSDENHKSTYINRTLEVLNSVTGEIVFTENLDETTNRFQFYNDSYPNIDMLEFYWKSENVIWKYYIE